MNNDGSRPRPASSCRKYCNVFGCLRNSSSNPELTYFRLPADEERRTLWLQLMERGDLKDRPSNNYYVCEIHFKERDVLVSPTRKLLKKNAAPSLYLPGMKKEDKQTQIETVKFDSYAQTENSISNSTTQTPVFVSSDVSAKRILKTNFAYFKNKSKKQEEEHSPEEPQNRLLHKLCEKFSSKDLTELTKIQTYLKHCYETNSYTLTYIHFCMKFYYASPRAYRLLEQTLCLPCRTSLYKLSLPNSSEVNDDMLLALKVKVSSMTKDEKNCSVVLDLVDLEANLFYDIKKDKIIGFHEVDGIQSPKLAKFALVVFVRGIFVNWTQPIGFALLSELQNNDEISEWINKIMTKLLDAGVKIKAFVSNHRLDFLDLLERKSVTVDRPYFFIGDTKIHYIFDAPHLMASVCDNMMIYDFYYSDGCIAKYEHIVQFYERDKTNSLRLVSKITDEHVRPTGVAGVKIRHALQLLSKSVAGAISLYTDFNVIDESGRDTARLILMMNDLFDLLNSSFSGSCQSKTAFCGNDYQIVFLNEMLQFFQCLKVINSENESDVTQSVKFIKGFQITIKSILRLFEDLKRNGRGLLPTRQLNQDISRQFFRKVTLKYGTTPKSTSWQFVYSFKKLYLCNILKPPKENNCKDLMAILIQHNIGDKCRSNQTGVALVHDDEQLQGNKSWDVHCSDHNELWDIRCSDYNQLLIPTKNYYPYISGALLKQCAKKHNDCELFQSYMACLNRKTLNFETRFLRFKNNVYNLLVVPCDDFVNHIREIDEIFLDTFQKQHINCRIGTSIYDKVKDVTFRPPCPCFPTVYLQKLFVRMRIYHTVNRKNKTSRLSPRGIGRDYGSPSTTILTHLSSFT